VGNYVVNKAAPSDSIPTTPKEITHQKREHLITKQEVGESYKQFEESKIETSKVPVGTGAYFLENLRKMEKIEVTGWENTLRGERNTIMYIVEFYMNRQKFTAKRSLSEFGYFMKEMAKKYPAINFPERPIRSKKGADDENQLKERAATFDKFLTICLRNELFAPSFAQFLSPLSELPIFGLPAQQPAQTTERSRVASHGFGVLLGTSNQRPTESPSASLNNSILRTSSMAQMGDEADDSAQIITLKKPKEDKFYLVEAVSAFFQGTKKETYYKFKIREAISNQVVEVSKRYSEFKTLDENLREFYKKDPVSLPALPYKGDLSFMIPNKDSRVIEYRKVALKMYLQTLLNDRIVKDNKILENFIYA